MLEAREVWAGYGAEPVVRGASLCVAPGERVVLVGRNGSGKSTLARVLNGSVRPRRGTLVLDGAAGPVRTELARAVGFVRQDPRNQIVSALVEDEVAFGPRNLGLAREEVSERVREALAATGLSSLGGRMTSELSGGQQQLLAVAGVLAMRPRYLVLDEAGSQLDEATRARLADIVDALLARGVGVLEVAHVPEAVFGATRVLVMSEGTPVCAGAPRDFLGSEELLVRSGLSDDALAWAVHEGVRSGYVPGRRLDAGALAEYLSGEADLEGRDGFFAPRAVACAPAGPSVDLRDVSVTYGDVRALADVSLAVSGVTLLLGVSGSGKTTAARVLAGVQEPDEGEAALDGCPVVPGDVGLAFQRPEDQLFADTVLDDIAYGPLMRTGDAERAHEAARRAAETLGVGEELFERSPFELSGGQMRRVALAGVAAAEPAAYVFDEPTAGLDAPSRRALLELVRALASGGAAVAVITHDAGEWLSAADRVVFLRQGSVTAEAPAARALAAPELFRETGLRPPALVELRALVGRDRD